MLLDIGKNTSFLESTFKTFNKSSYKIEIDRQYCVDNVNKKGIEISSIAPEVFIFMSNSSGLMLQLKQKVTKLGKVNFLIVADEPANADAIAEVLLAAGISFTFDTIAASQFLIDLPSKTYSAILYNYYSPYNYQSVDSLLKQLKLCHSTFPQIPLILITDALGDEIAIKCIRLGVSHYLLREKLAKLPAVLSKLTDKNVINEQKSTQTTLDLLKQQHKYIKQLEAEKQHWEAAEAAWQEQISYLNHELRNPIAAILGFARMLKEQLYGPLNAKQLQYACLMADTGQHLLDLVNNYLGLAKIEADKEQIHLDNLAVEDICLASMSIVQERAREQGLELILRTGEDVDFCEADRLHLKQILVNLLSNAVKFTQKGSVTLKVELQEDLLFFNVIDTGIGISPQDIQKLFQPFQQVKGHQEGTGLGLVLSRKLAQLHGGDITVASEVGKGSCFTLYIPRYQP